MDFGKSMTAKDVCQGQGVMPSPNARRPVKITLPASVGRHMAACMTSVGHNLEQAMQKTVVEILVKQPLRRKKQLEDLIRQHEHQLKSIREQADEELKVIKAENARRIAALQEEAMAEIEDVKCRTWCTVCLHEASYKCCWGTNYCGSDCQAKDFSTHMANCTQVEEELQWRELGVMGQQLHQ